MAELERELVTKEQIEPLEYLFGDDRHPIESDADYHTVGLIFDEDE